MNNVILKLKTPKIEQEMNQKMKSRKNDLGKEIRNGTGEGLISKTSSAKLNCYECGTSNGLHHFKCLPSHLRFNRFVRTGYRLNLTTWQCLKSLFYFHNETFNVYSHGKTFAHWYIYMIHMISYFSCICCFCSLWCLIAYA